MKHSQSHHDRLQELLPNLMTPSPRLQEVTFLRFQLSQRHQGLLPMQDVRESLLVSTGKISPIPNMPVAFMGLMSSRNQVFGVIDLAQALGVAQELKARQTCQIIVVHTAKPTSQQDQSLLGLAVSKIEGVSRIASPELLPLPSSLPSDARPAMSGTLNIESKSYLMIRPDALTSLTRLSLDSV